MSVVEIEGEYLDGFHVEHLPQFSDNQLDRAALSGLAGMRAVWLLYWLGQWDHLEDLGVDREHLEPILDEFRVRYGQRPTVRQVQQLKKIPELVEASKELRTAYALKYLDKRPLRIERKQPMEMSIYHAEVKTQQEADDAVKYHEAEVKAAGGTMEVGYGRSGSGCIVMVKLPTELGVDPANLLPTAGLKFSKVRAQVQVPVPEQPEKDPRFPKSGLSSPKGGRRG